MSQTAARKLARLLKQIALSRRRMQKLWDKKGRTDEEVLAASVELDELLNQYDLLRPFARDGVYNASVSIRAGK